METQPKAPVIRKKLKNPVCSSNEKCDSIPLYLGASALFISVVTVIFFYREIRKMKKDIGDIKQIKNQIANVDSRFDVMDSSIEELAQLIKEQQNFHQPEPPKPRVTFKSPIIEEKTLKLPEPEDEEIEYESDSDEIEVESVEGN